MDDNNDPTSVIELERTWYFDKSNQSTENDFFGHVRYGTYGFKADLKNNRTKKVNYERQTDDVEEIPLYFQFWSPAGKSITLAAFQSFQGRSCVQIVLEHLKQTFELAHPDLLLKYKKLAPNDAKGSIFDSAPVKSLKLIKRNEHADLADRYHKSGTPDCVDIELILKAKKRQSLGSFKNVADSVRSDGVIIYRGMDFEEAIAMVRVGNKVRPVGMFGDHSNAGVIDITPDIDFGLDGHPTMESVRTQTLLVLADFFKRLKGK